MVMEVDHCQPRLSSLRRHERHEPHVFVRKIIIDQFEKRIFTSDHKEIVIVSKVEQTLEIKVNPAPPAPLEIITKTLPEATVGQSYQGQIEVSGGVPPDTLSIVQGQLPDGLVLKSDGSISGTPTDSAVTQDFTIRVTDSQA